MTISRHAHMKAALRRLAARPPQNAEITESDLPRLLRAPSVVILWMIAMLTVVALVGLSRVRVPHSARGVVITVIATPERHRETLLLLPPSSGSRVRAGQLVSVDTGGAKPAALLVARVESELLDARRARARYPGSPGVLVHLDTPKLAARVDWCPSGSCLTPNEGTAYAATASLGARTLASYVVPDP